MKNDEIHNFQEISMADRPLRARLETKNGK
jgi:hypothetical protein